MARRKSLPERFPGKSVVKIKLWTKDRTTIEMDGPLSEGAADLISIVPMINPCEDDELAMSECLARIKANSKIRGPS